MYLEFKDPLNQTKIIDEKLLSKNRKKSPLQVDVNKRSRYIPASIRRFTYQRAKGRCEHTEKNGTRCSNRYQLEFDHIVPVALNGSNEAENIRVVCSVHNSYLASQKNIGFETTSFYMRK